MYVFTRLPESVGVGRKCELAREGEVAGVWQGAERFKLQAHDAFAADRFGSAVSYLVRIEDGGGGCVAVMIPESQVPETLLG